MGGPRGQTLYSWRPSNLRWREGHSITSSFSGGFPPQVRADNRRGCHRIWLINAIETTGPQSNRSQVAVLDLQKLVRLGGGATKGAWPTGNERDVYFFLESLLWWENLWFYFPTLQVMEFFWLSTLSFNSVYTEDNSYLNSYLSCGILWNTVSRSHPIFSPLASKSLNWTSSLGTFFFGGGGLPVDHMRQFYHISSPHSAAMSSVLFNNFLEPGPYILGVC